MASVSKIDAAVSMSSEVALLPGGALVDMEGVSADGDTPNKCHFVHLVPVDMAACPLVAVSVAGLVVGSAAVVDSVVTVEDSVIADLAIVGASAVALEVGMVEEVEAESDISPTDMAVLPREPHPVHAVVVEEDSEAVASVVVTTIEDSQEDETATAGLAAPMPNLSVPGNVVAAIAIATVTAKVGMEAAMITHASEPMMAVITTTLDPADGNTELLRLLDCPFQGLSRLGSSTSCPKVWSEGIPCSFAFFPLTSSARFSKHGNAPKSMATRHSTIGQVWGKVPTCRMIYHLLRSFLRFLWYDGLSAFFDPVLSNPL